MREFAISAKNPPFFLDAGETEFPYLLKVLWLFTSSGLKLSPGVGGRKAIHFRSPESLPLPSSCLAEGDTQRSKVHLKQGLKRRDKKVK